MDHKQCDAKPVPSAICGCCKRGLRDCYAYPFTDLQGSVHELFSCPDCGCQTPVNHIYEERSTTLREQTMLHEELWSQCPASELFKTATELSSLVQLFVDRHWLPAPTLDAPLVVELGAGRGCLLQALRSKGFRVTACEPSQILAKQAQNIFGFDPDALYITDAQHFINRLRQISAPVGSFVMWHVLEHINDPIPLVRSLLDLLTPEGTLIVQTPLLAQSNFSPRELRFYTKQSFFYFSEQTHSPVIHQSIDEDNMFLTTVFRKLPFIA